MINELYSLVYSQLLFSSPVLSGNMKSHISIVSVEPKEITIAIEAPFYDMNEWKKTGKIVLTGKTYGEITDYAEWVNKSGGFGKHNQSMHWVNRVLNECCLAIANQKGAEVINELPL